MSLASLSQSQSVLGKPNFDSIIERLMRLNPAQRQQFAQLHADDPLMLSAAKYADSEIKKIDQAYLAKQSGAAPPKINEQVVQAIGQPVQPPPPPQGQPAGQPPPPPPQGQPQAAQALPENSGIAQLPAPNLAKMAGGGIVAFARGDIVKGADGQDYYEGEGGKLLEAGSTEATIDAAKVNVPKAYNALKEGFNQIDFAGNEAGIVGSALAGSKAPVAAPSKNPAIPLPPSGASAGRGMGGAPAPKVVSSDVLAERLAAKQRPAVGPTQATSQGPQGPQGPQGLAALQASLMPTGPGVDPYAETHAAMASREAVQGELEKADALQRQAGLASIIAPREARQKGREDRIQSAEDLSTKMAIINAGLAMMQSTGKGLSGIAEGAAVGAKQYAEGKKASELARQKMEDAKDAFDEFRYNAGNMAQKDVTAAKRAIVAGANAADQIGITAKAADLAQQRASANTLFEASARANESALDRSSRERTAAISAQVQREIAAMPGAAERMYATFGGGDAKKGFEYFTAATAEGKGNEAIIQAVMKTPEILSTVSPELRKAIEAEVMKRFPQVQDKPGSRP